jgi:hypothetical protein
MELEGQDFHAKVADAYLKIAEEHPERFVVVDADREQGEVSDAVRDAIERALERQEDVGRSARRSPRSARPPAEASTSERGEAHGPAPDAG